MGKKEIEPTVLFFPNPIVLVTSQGLESKPNRDCYDKTSKVRLIELKSELSI
jgi:hypothetical protein